MTRGIQFRDIKPHGGRQSWAFEELCFQLFSHEYRSKGEPVRREGSGGDGGMEGFIEGKDGRAVIGLQAKYFVDEFADSQWRKIDGSVKTVLKNNTAENALREFIVATTRVFTPKQREKWNRLRKSWKDLAQKLGYTQSPKFVHWDVSRLTRLLLKPENRGQLLYWFETPDFDMDRCRQLTSGTAQGLEERYIPKLHTRTDCEATIHRFLRSDHAHSDFGERTRNRLHTELDRRWISYSEWSEAIKPLVEATKCHLQVVIDRLGDGFTIPVSVRELIGSTKILNESFRRLREAVRHEHESDNLDYELFGNSEGFYFDREFEVADQQCLLVLGEAGKGKTHTLAEICTRYSVAGGAVLFMEGQRFGTDKTLWSQLLQWADFNGGIRDFLSCYSAMSESSPLCGLICIDALNETTPRRDVWLNGLHAFAAELKPFPRIKLIVSCRSDYAELTVPQSILEDTSPGWDVTTHRGLGMNVFDAVPRYLNAYSVKGFTPQLFVPEFETPLMLKTFCEAFEGKAVPHGTLSLPTILREYVGRKSKKIANSIGCARTAVPEALRRLADAISTLGRLRISEREARDICRAVYPEVTESRSLYRALLSEGMIHELVQRASDGMGDDRTVRFAFERIWDYFLSERLWPGSNGRRTTANPELLMRLKDKKWRNDHPGPMGMLAIRLPEAGPGELHDVIGIEPRHPDGRSVDIAFRQSIQWRTGASCTERTRNLLNALQLSSDSNFKLLVALSLHDEHRWNADYLHQQLAAMPLGKRDQTWTKWLNAELMQESDSKSVFRIIRMAEETESNLLSDSLALLCGTSLVWMLATTVVAARRRIAVALAKLLKGRCDVAARLFERFEEVDDPYILDRLLFACASAAIHAPPRDKGLMALASRVHSKIFGGDEVPANILIRYYASLICEQSHSKGSLPPAVEPSTFRPPFHSVWPKIMSPKREAALLQKVRENSGQNKALNSVVSSTRTTHGGNYGDWGRYVMEYAVTDFQRRRLNQKPLSGHSFHVEFDARVARRFVLQRVLELGLDPAFPDETSGTNYTGRDRPQAERLGKKYQWIALAEFLGLLWDHYHRTEPGEISADISTQYHFPYDLLDPSITELHAIEPDKKWSFIASESPWWIRYRNPILKPLSPIRRDLLATTIDVQSPQKLLRCSDGETDWFVLDALHKWIEPVPCFKSYSSFKESRANVHWAVNSFLVPTAKFTEFAEVITQSRIENDMCPDTGAFQAELHRLTQFPASSVDLPSLCQTSFAPNAGAWFTTCCYSNGQEGDLGVSGRIPSPQLARVMQLKWLGSHFDFCTSDSRTADYQYAAFGTHWAGLIKAGALLAAMKRCSRKLVWRVYGWKWVASHDVDTYKSREYWAAYSLSENGSFECLGGGTWIMDPNPVIEPLPWNSEQRKTSKRTRRAPTRRSRS